MGRSLGHRLRLAVPHRRAPEFETALAARPGSTVGFEALRASRRNDVIVRLQRMRRVEIGKRHAAAFVADLTVALTSTDRGE